MTKDSGHSRITLMSFGFKYGLPNANYYFDVGFVKNPARESKWSFFSEPSGEMVAYVLDQEKVREFIDKVLPLLVFLSAVDQHQVFAFGCNAGRHRSSILVGELSRRLKGEGIDNDVIHRDLRS
jgi:RNase adaptor protein for sRNA GlmZ degradation